MNKSGMHLADAFCPNLPCLLYEANSTGKATGVYFLPIVFGTITHHHTTPFPNIEKRPPSARTRARLVPQCSIQPENLVWQRARLEEETNIFRACQSIWPTYQFVHRSDLHSVDHGKKGN